ncbi:MAG: IS481 family transposase, partial [Novosphingobium sp.]|nr:IS481 family transposase [Novosphingobium sp.]
MPAPHPSSRTTAEIRREIRASTDSLKVLAARFGINPKTVAKWKNRESCDDLPSGRKLGNLGKLTAEDADIIARFREQTLLPLDDCLYALQAQIPHLRRSSLHRCLQQYGISNLAKTVVWEQQPAHRAAYPLGHLHIERSVVHIGDQTYFLFNAIDQASKFVVVRKGLRGGPLQSAEFLAALAVDLPFPIRQVITPVAEPFAVGGNVTSHFTTGCHELGIEHRLSSIPQPWTLRPGARMGRMGSMLEDSITLASEDYLVQVLQQFVEDYNFRRRLKSLGGRTPYQFI